MSAQSSAITKLITRLLLRGEPLEEIVKLLANTTCYMHNPALGEYSCADAMAQALKEDSP